MEMRRIKYVIALYVLLQLIVGYRMISAVPPPLSPIVQGIVQVNGKPYRAVCNCNPDAMSGEQAQLMKNVPMCAPSKIKITEDHTAAAGLNLSDVREIYGQPANLEMAKISQHQLSCMDDRIGEKSIFSPGGDLGEFFLGVSTLASLLKTKLTEDNVADLFDKYLSSIPSGREFHYCTDDDAVSNLEKSLNMEGLDITNPPATMRDDILDALSSPTNVGDLHFKSMMKSPQFYNVDPELITTVQRVFYKRLWDRTASYGKLYLDVLRGKREPKAFLEVTVSQECRQADMAPVMRPNARKVHAVIHHTSSGESRRRELADFFVKNGGSVATFEEFYSRMDRQGLKGLEATAMRSYSDLRFYNLVIA